MRAPRVLWGVGIGDHQLLFNATASSTLAASSALSVAVSSTSYSSLILMRWMGSFSLSNGFSAQAIGFVFQPMDLYAMLQH